MKIETILMPAELPALAQRDLRATACVVFDVLRATSTFVTALHHGAQAIIPVSEIAGALEIKKAESGKRKAEIILLGGERDGVRISANGIDFDLGNSPREFTPERVRGKIIVSTTTNGTRALQACIGAKKVLAASFLNLSATADFLRGENEILLVCAGTGRDMADEDVLAAGALAELLAVDTQGQVGRAVLCPPSAANRDVLVHPNGAQRTACPTLSPTSETALKSWLAAKSDLLAAMSRAKNGARLLTIPDLHDDVAFCAQRDVFNLVAALSPDGALRRV